jgi:hypothetical protein
MLDDEEEVLLLLVTMLGFGVGLLLPLPNESARSNRDTNEFVGGARVGADSACIDVVCARELLGCDLGSVEDVLARLPV